MTTQALRDLEFALEAVYGGSDQSIEAGCVADQLADLGWKLVPISTRRPTRRAAGPDVSAATGTSPVIYNAEETP